MTQLSKLFALALLLVSVGAFAGNKTAGEAVDDTWIHTKVKTELIGKGTSNINIEVYDGVVQLAGFVESDAQRIHAEKTAASVKGVKEVSNQLYVQTAQRQAGRTLDDGMVATKVKAKLTDNETTNGFDINVEVRHGVVLLSGFVESDEERQAAINAAKTVDGVIDVINGMDLIPSAA